MEVAWLQFVKVDLDDIIKKYLCPKYATKVKQKDSYINFYKENILSGNPIIRDILDFNDEIKEYLKLKIGESEAAFEAKVKG